MASGLAAGVACFAEYTAFTPRCAVNSMARSIGIWTTPALFVCPSVAVELFFFVQANAIDLAAVIFFQLRFLEWRLISA